MTVAELNELRTSLRELGVEYKVVKNTLARIASDGTPIGVARERFKGPVGVALGYDDPVKAAQGMVKFAGKNDKLVLTAAVVEGQLVEAGAIKAIAALPPRPVLLSVLAGAMNAPMSKMAAAFQATVSSFGYALKALEAKKQAAG
jgi:large subunit ribosomal protein L10